MLANANPAALCASAYDAGESFNLGNKSAADFAEPIRESAKDKIDTFTRQIKEGTFHAEEWLAASRELKQSLIEEVISSPHLSQVDADTDKLAQELHEGLRFPDGEDTQKKLEGLKKAAFAKNGNALQRVILPAMLLGVVDAVLVVAAKQIPALEVFKEGVGENAEKGARLQKILNRATRAATHELHLRGNGEKLFNKAADRVDETRFGVSRSMMEAYQSIQAGNGREDELLLRYEPAMEKLFLASYGFGLAQAAKVALKLDREPSVPRMIPTLAAEVAAVFEVNPRRVPGWAHLLPLSAKVREKPSDYFSMEIAPWGKAVLKHFRKPMNDDEIEEWREASKIMKKTALYTLGNSMDLPRGGPRETTAKRIQDLVMPIMAAAVIDAAVAAKTGKAPLLSGYAPGKDLKTSLKKNAQDAMNATMTSTLELTQGILHPHEIKRRLETCKQGLDDNANTAEKIRETNQDEDAYPVLLQCCLTTAHGYVFREMFLQAAG